MRRLCPTCGKPVEAGRACPRCSRPRDPRRSHGSRTREREAARMAENPWRRSYGSAEYRRARELALSRTDGRCAACGARIADRRGGRWVMRIGAGGVHHVRPLSGGGGNGAENLVPLCSRCHNRADAERRMSK